MKMAFVQWIKNLRDPQASQGTVTRTNKDTHQVVPIAAEIFSVDQMERYGERLAQSHKLSTRKAPYYLLNRLTESEKLLSDNCNILSAGGDKSIAPAGEWLLDNFYLIEEHIRLVRQLLPKNFGKGLPTLIEPQSCPRIYDIAAEAIAHSDGHWDANTLVRFITAYQRVTPLKLGELWAFPGMLRLALIENLRRISIEVTKAQQERNLAESWANKIQDSAENDPANLIIVIADMARTNPPRTSAFVAELVRRLQGHGSMLALPLTWIEQRLADVGLSSAELISRFNQQLALNQLSVSNSIAGLRKLNEMNWADFAESVSEVEKILHQDPAGVYPAMSFATRDNYRHVIEKLARNCQFTEQDIASRVIAMSAASPAESQKRHVGYFLVDTGRSELERVLDIHYSPLNYFRHQMNKTPLLSWLGSLSLLTTALTANLMFETHDSGMNWVMWLLLLPIIIMCSQFVMDLLNETASRSRTPRSLPRMDFSQGIPENSTTLVAIPCLLTSRSSIDKLINSLEVCYLGNTHQYLYFSLVADFIDSDTAHSESSDLLLDYASSKIIQLNRRHGAENDSAPSRFTLLHRESLLNPSQGVWMGYERKRGKLSALNRWLRGDKNTFTTCVGASQQQLSGTKYVITLDSDTVLPRDHAHQLVATLAHPLNHPFYDPALKRVTKGYGILQPRLAEEIPRNGQSRYAAISSSLPGTDPYSSMSSDIYQDIFGEGSFVGKGIYDVDTFTLANDNTCPENLVLSHDLLEGCYARSGGLSDVVLYEQYPANYLVDVARRTRWIRGDWQLLNWLRLNVRQADDMRCPNPLSMLSRWKLLDNLRRSLAAPSLMIALFSALLLVPNPLYWLLFIVTLLVLPSVAALILNLFNKDAQVNVFPHIKCVACGLLDRLARIGLYLATLPHHSAYTLHAIFITLWRLNVSHKHLHEWVSSAELNKPHFSLSKTNLYRVMWANPLAGLLVIVLTDQQNPQYLAVAAPLGGLWLIAPLIIGWMSKTPDLPQPQIDTTQRLFLRRTSRETWSYFSTFVNQQENWLPPDNYQEIPEPKIAHRTSPTNIGLSLLANMTAMDFGYLTQGGLLQRTSQTLDTLDKLEHYRGHLYNWYDTRTLMPLNPRYISSVDSGNLAGHLLVLGSGIAQLRSQPAMDIKQLLTGLDDTLLLAEAEATSPMGDGLIKLRQAWVRASEAPLHQVVDELALMQPINNELIEHFATSSRWLRELDAQLQDFIQEWSLLFGWLSHEPSTKVLPSLLCLSRLEHKLPELEQQKIARSASAAQQRLKVINELEQRIKEHARMDFGFLFRKTTQLLSVGFNCETNKLDVGSYDLLPSEIRLTSYFAIATNQLPLKSWFALGRLFTMVGNQPSLMSWSGSMFEYLMPQLVMPTYPDTLLVQMSRAAVDRQISWGKENGVPWGVSESAYAAFDQGQNYQYRAFGVPGLGLKRGLGEDMVIAPYATVMALVVEPQRALANLERLDSLGARGKYGFYEALDYSRSRLNHGEIFSLVRTYMAHHQGMSLLALSHTLLNAPMVERFVANPWLQSALPLLQERVPDAPTMYSPRRQFDTVDALQPVNVELRLFNRAEGPTPEVQLLSNTQYHLMLTQTGGGYSTWRNLALTRWRADATRDNYGTFCFIADGQTGQVLSNTLQPLSSKSGHYQAIFTDAAAEFMRIEGSLSIQTKIVVSPEDDVEIRRLTLTHRGRQPREIEITTYAEVVLAPLANDMAHRAFSNLFVQTELVMESEGILCHRRPREENEECPWLFHMTAIHGQTERKTSFATDRASFIGRGRTISDSQAMQNGGALDNHAGPVLDPIMAIRQRVELKPGTPLVIDLVYGISSHREQSLQMMEKYRDHNIADRVFTIARSHSQVALRQINANEEQANIFNQLAGSIIFPGAEMRPCPQILSRNRRGQSSLWSHSISGDLPIVLLSITRNDSIALVTTLIQAHSYWRMKGLLVDLLILNDSHEGYQQELHNEILNRVAAGAESSLMDKNGGIFVRTSEHITAEDLTLLMSVAAVTVDDRNGELIDQLNKKMQPSQSVLPRLVTQPNLQPPNPSSRIFDTQSLRFFNGFGGFSADGREYQILLGKGKNTPAPWANVLANDNFGSVVSESGQAYTWFENAHEFRLTPWENDPVSDSSGEAFYLRDEESGDVWSPMPLPIRNDEDYLCRHGFGYSVFEHRYQGIDSELTILVAEQAAVKLFILTLSNQSGRTRKLSATGYVEWVLSDLRSKSSLHVTTSAAQVSAGCGVLATNYYGNNGSERNAFFGVTGVHCSVTGDRKEFLGRNGSPASPAALLQERLSNKTGAALDSCAAVQSATKLIDGDQRTFIFALGVGNNANEAEQLIAQFMHEQAARAELDNVHRFWHQKLDKIQITTPEPAVNLLVNGWLIYQTLASRIMARSGYYQSGGAFGFRDQLQDTLALAHAAPERMREQILLCACHQFVEGDVQHWWHPPTGRGVRTRCSDDYLWLPLALCHYIDVTGDTEVAMQQVTYIETRRLAPEEESFYGQPLPSSISESLFEHCLRAIRHGLNFGEHGLPLMGSGDWNDGMNNVGIKGKGESVWLGFFLLNVLQRFALLAENLQRPEIATLCHQQAKTLKQNLHDNAWDGEWYLRGFFDSGETLGSHLNAECQIDAIAQSWAVLAEAEDPERTRRAMASLDSHLVDESAGLIKLLTPPFNDRGPNPGYIRGYLPGVRENGGQYTHGAIWAVMAFAEMGETERAWQLLAAINPVNHSLNPEAVERYKVEPYVMTADIYSVSPHIGRGGWSWYTGSAGWAYRLITESLLGIKRHGEFISINTRLPADWPQVSLTYQQGSSQYQITVKRAELESCVMLDGQNLPDMMIPIKDDGHQHQVEVWVKN
ncbi:GH36-type glycosyl hydrolase domain-containing protein [Serratia sp. M24T3]|uniref:GH36-type glycosyl hydrolase domain-containing protein n=1 Tax=Serratia sp. M24T3 TaxID=932213 RepID=UPI0026BA16CC